MKVLFYEPYAINIPHFERCLELMQLHLDKNDEVYFIGCNADLPACDVNAGHNYFTCKSCIARQNDGLGRLSANVIRLPLIHLKPDQKATISKISLLKFNSIQDLKQLQVEGFDLGYAVASSLISSLRNPVPDMNRHKTFISRNLVAALRVYFSVSNYLEENQPDLVYLFNGRFAVLRAAFRACEKAMVKFYTHEVGFSIDKYSLFANDMPHTIANRQKQIVELWDAADPDEREKIGASFFEDRMKGKLLDPQYHFVKDQKSGLLPDEWDTEKHNIVIFNSSDDEFAAIGDEWKLPFYDSQIDGLNQIFKDLEIYSDTIHLYLRIHPNYKTAKPEVTQPFLDLKAKNLTVIPPTSKISTYALMAAADKVVAFLSSAGIESVYIGKPVISLGRNMYSGLGSTYNPTNHEEAIEILLNENLTPKDKTGALMFGHFYKSYGIPYKYYKAETLYKGSFKGKPVTAPWITEKLGEVFKKIYKLRTGMK